MAKKTFQRKPADGGVKYKWSPIEKLPKDISQRKAKDKNRFCNATPSSQGEDFIVTYVYNSTFINGEEHRYAYVACDYVK